MKHTICLAISLMLSIGAFAQNEWDIILFQYETICNECIKYRELINSGETVSKQELDGVREKIADMQKMLSSNDEMTLEQKARLGKIRSNYEIRSGLRVPVEEFPRINPATDTVEYVDLGLSVLWATCNLGAKSPIVIGNYYSWGETSPKNEYRKDNNKWIEDSSAVKYLTDSRYGKPDNRTQLEPRDDAATVALGNGWRMPTEKEFQELKECCKWTWYENGPIKGYVIRSYIEGYTDATIFLRACNISQNRHKEYKQVRYWTSTLRTPNNQFAVQLDASINAIYLNGGYRYIGRPIRPVKDK